MRILELPEIRGLLVYPELIGRMREALLANWRGECDTPMPMHLDVAPEHAEVHMKSSYRRGGSISRSRLPAPFQGMRCAACPPETV